MTISAHQIARWRISRQNMVADPGQNLKSLPKKRSGKGSCTKKPFRNAQGIAESKTLRKREQRLRARLQDHAASLNAETYKDSDRRYRKPGALK